MRWVYDPAGVAVRPSGNVASAGRTSPTPRHSDLLGFDILQKIISGGQTGADRGALDAAIALGFPCGGWCPEGRNAEDGPIPESYPLQVLPGAGYRQRTIRNIQDSDGTAILCLGEPSGGSALTLAQCRRLNKPHLLIDGHIEGVGRAAELLLAFVDAFAIETLNIAGPSEGRSPGTHLYVEAAVTGLLACTRSRAK